MKYRKKSLLGIISIIFISIISGIMIYKATHSQDSTPYPTSHTQNLTLTLSSQEREQAQKAVFAGGCFWCMEGIFEAQDGVYEATSGYIGGSAESANYTAVSSGNTQHRESVQVSYNPEKISYETLVELYWTQIDPTDPNGQFADQGFHYTTAIYYANEDEKGIAKASKQALTDSGKFEKPIVTSILPLTDFYPAESYHQDYYKKSSFRYDLYKRGSGREGFIEENWKERIVELAPPTASQLSPSSKGTNRASFEEGGVRRTQGAAIEGIEGKSPGEILEATYSDEALKEKLTPLQYRVTQEGATERAFQNEYWDNKEAGIYVDIIDGTPLYSSLDKYDSGSGWPSFTRTIDEANISMHEDNTLFSTRTELKSTSSDAHLGHVFPDGPKEAGGMRHCINSAALRFIPLADLEKEGYAEYTKLFQ